MEERALSESGVAFAEKYHLKVPFAKHLGFEIDALEPGIARMSCILQEHMTNSWGTAHGGVIMTMLDVSLCMAARTLHPDSAGVMTIEMSTTFIDAGQSPLKAEARVLRNGRSMIFVEGEVRNADGTLVAKALGTVRARQPDKKAG
jgi:uncharacterized protein (TIGR00369 family)